MSLTSETKRGPDVVDGLKVVRLGRMLQSLLDEARAMPLDPGSRQRLEETYAQAAREVRACLPMPLRAELTHVSTPVPAAGLMSDAELRIAHAQLIGWLEGLLHGAQFAALIEMAQAGRIP